MHQRKLGREFKIEAVRMRGARLTSVIASNVFDRQFTATPPNQHWIGDFTYVWTTEGWL